MIQKDSTKKTKITTKSLDDEIAAAEEKVRRLREQKRVADIKAREKNVKAVLEMLKAEKLDVVSSDTWQRELPKIRTILIGKHSEGSAVAPTASTGEAEAKAA